MRGGECRERARPLEVQAELPMLVHTRLLPAKEEEACYRLVSFVFILSSAHKCQWWVCGHRSRSTGIEKILLKK